MLPIWLTRKAPNKCLLEGEETPVIYNACSEKREVAIYKPEVFKYLGKGKIHTVDGYKYNDEKIYHFWEYMPEYKHLQSIY